MPMQVKRKKGCSEHESQLIHPWWGENSLLFMMRMGLGGTFSPNLIPWESPNEQLSCSHMETSKEKIQEVLYAPELQDQPKPQDDKMDGINMACEEQPLKPLFISKSLLQEQSSSLVHLLKEYPDVFT